ncbi:hypothetical protein MB90_003604 [Salmonella enterica subsp. enterica]|nr:hypothetical protein [Salmonella enterica]ECB3971281.1 hypothetical protein [Salmonella enterica subsp. enterica serovar Lexington]ECC3314433.1 hypothetical protein [Salmonella enterica subsp. enterica]EDW0190542.1 hypothetical protein [Salmonella enterica subsp. enterica serovar Orion]EDX3404872.1 hypothetical protein [Salmonella enterica subsp. enterica serovar Weltevreden]EGI4905623.1 hypothetical protein [Salmonella enterica subsp. enterica serovar Lanka]
MTALNKHAELRKELSNPAIGSKDHLRKLALSLLDELEAEQGYREGAFVACNRWHDKFREEEAKLEAAEKRIAELSASQSKLREGMAAIYNAICENGASTSLSAILTLVKRSREESASAAGIGVKGE